MKKLLLLICLILLALPVYAGEQRCDDLGANCVCSNDLDTASWVNPSSNWYYPSDTDSGRCSETTVGGQPVNWVAPMTPAAVAESGMPSGNTVTNVMELVYQANSEEAGIKLLESISGISGRSCVRYYLKYSSSYQMPGDGSCSNNKLMRIGDYYTTKNSNFWSSNGVGFTPSIDPDTCKNKWCRLEYCVDAMPPNSTTYEAYYYNVTDGTPEKSFTHTARLGESSHDHAWLIDGYRAGNCVGSKQLSYALFANWATDSGQRIGAACEVEPDAAGCQSDCTDGTDCYCDKVADSGHDFYDPNMLLCEDFEASTLHDDVNRGGGAPLYGPWDDATGGADGFNSYWSKNYADCVNGCDGTSGWCNEWRSDDLWGYNAQACIDIVQNGEFDDEISANPDPFVPGFHTGVFGDKQSFSHRVRAGATGGIVGRVDFPSAQTELGITMAVAYSTNSSTSGVYGAPWKHNEMFSATAGGDGPFLFHEASSLNEQDPFHTFFQSKSGEGEAGCNSSISGATIDRGTFTCNDTQLRIRPTTTYYTRSTDWPFGEWACVRAHFTGLGTSNQTGKIWLNETLIIDYRNVDGTRYKVDGGYDGMYFNNYANTNESGGAPDTTATTYRYEDNIHITAGAPVSCEQIGMVGLPADPSPPSVPGSLTPTVISQSQIDLSWTASTDAESGVSNYQVYRCDATASAGCDPATLIASPTGTTYSDTGLTANNTYRYKVRARNGAGLFSNFSSTVEATTSPAVFDFSMSNSGGISVVKTESDVTTITATLTSGSTENVSFSVTGGLPTGATAQFSPTDCSPTCNSTLTITTDATTPTGGNTITVQGTNGVLNRTTQFTLTVSDSAQFSITLGDDPGEITDTWININTTNHATDDFLHLYTWPDNERSNATIVKADIAANIPNNATVVSAVLTLRLTEADSEAAGGNPSCPATYSVGAHKLLKNVVLTQATGYIFSTGNNWTANAHRADGIPLAQSSSDIATAEVTVALDKTLEDKTWSIPTMVQQWVTTPSTNYGVLINSDTSVKDCWRIFASQDHATSAWRPTLAITYNIPGAPEDPGSGTVTGGGSMTIKGGGAGGQTWR